MKPVLATGLAALLAAACLDGPAPDEVTLSLATPNADDGAVSFAVIVSAPNEVTGASALCAGCEIFYTQVSRSELRGIVTGDLVAGPLVRVGVLRAAPIEAYRVDVVEVANRQFDPVPSAGYTLTAKR